MTNNFYYFFKEKSLKMLLFGFSSGLPILLVFSTLSVWLSKAGIERSTITLFSWAGFAYAFKYLWSPIIDKFSLPIFKKFGHRRSWLLLVQLLIIFSLILTSFTDPQKNLYATAFFIVLLAFFSASQDIIIFFVISALLTLTGLNFITAVSGAASSISNVGPGLGNEIGPNSNYASLPSASKWILSAGMILGRLEIFAILVIFLPSFWRN